jgi:hypothetical protein
MIDTPPDTSPVLIITGCPRSGTSLLSAELTRRYDIAIPFETHFVPIFQRWLSLYGDLHKAVNRRRLLNDIYLFTRMWLRIATTYDQAKIALVSILSTGRLADKIVENSCDYPSLCRAIYAAFAHEHRAATAAEKSAFFAPIPLDVLRTAFDEIRVIHIVRDGRDVYLSWRKTWFGTRVVARAATLWVDHIRNAELWAEAYPESCITIRYEDLITSPDVVFSSIATFAALDSRTELVPENSKTLATALASSQEHRLLQQGINPHNMNKHEREMPEKAARQFELIAGQTLTRYGYNVSRNPETGGLRLFSLVDWILGAPSTLILWAGKLVKFSAPLLFACGLRPAFRYWTRGIDMKPKS